jgi:hypothetical protein
MPRKHSHADDVLDPSVGLLWVRLRYAQESSVDADRLDKYAQALRAGQAHRVDATVESLEAQARHLRRTSALVCFHMAGGVVARLW